MLTLAMRDNGYSHHHHHICYCIVLMLAVHLNEYLYIPSHVQYEWEGQVFEVQY